MALSADNENHTVDFHRALHILGAGPYEIYLKSPHWINIQRLWVESGYPRHCIGCGIRSYQLHHLRYDNICHEALSDLLPLCGTCHQRVHAMELLGFSLKKPEEALAAALNWTPEQTESKFAEIRKCWAALPLGDLKIRGELFQVRLLVECPACHQRRWQHDSACCLCGTQCRIILDWR
jgi:hypothetical protein